MSELDKACQQFQERVSRFGWQEAQAVRLRNQSDGKTGATLRLHSRKREGSLRKYPHLSVGQW